MGSLVICKIFRFGTNSWTLIKLQVCLISKFLLNNSKEDCWNVEEQETEVMIMLPLLKIEFRFLRKRLCLSFKSSKKPEEFWMSIHLVMSNKFMKELSMFSEKITFFMNNKNQVGTLKSYDWFIIVIILYENVKTIIRCIWNPRNFFFYFFLDFNWFPNLILFSFSFVI